MWDREDYEGRWWQLVFGALLIPVCLFFVWLTLNSSGVDTWQYGSSSLALGAGYLSFRCFWYAATGKDNINRDDF